MTKEQLVLLPLAMAVSLVHPLIRRRRPIRKAMVVAVASGPVALAAWLAYLGTALTAEERAYQEGNIGLPFSLFPQMFEFATAMRVDNGFGAQIGSTAPSMIVGMGVILVAGSVVGLLRRDALGWFTVLMLGLTTCLGWRTLLFPHEALRIPAVALVFALVSLAVGRGVISPSREPAS